MQILPIQALPNQEFTVVLDGNLWNIELKTTNGCMSASFTLNGESIISNQRCVASEPLIPSRYLENGNFMFVTQSQQLPNYSQFGITQSLWYYSPSELDVFRVGDIMLNPLGGIPLRYKPQGYTAA